MKFLLIVMILVNGEPTLVGRPTNSMAECDAIRLEVLDKAEEKGIELIQRWCLAVNIAKR